MEDKGRWYFDIESNGLLDDSTVDYTTSPWTLRDNFVVHCIVATNIDTLETVSFIQEECYTKFKQWAIDNVSEIISHNGINFDMLVCKVAFDMDYSVTPDSWCGKSVVVHDTMVLSKVLNPDRRGHSIEWFGKQLGFPKIDWRAKAVELGLIAWNSQKGAEFAVYHPAMRDYCEQDVLVGVKTFHYLMAEWGEWNWQDAYDLEKAIAEIITRQAHRGFKFDSELALSNVKELDELMLERKQRVEPNLPEKPMGLTKQKEYIPSKNQFKLSGEPSANIIKWCAKHGGTVEQREDEGYFTTLYGKEYKLPIPQEPIVSTEPAQIDDTTFIKGVLVEMGWTPSQYKERDLTVDTKKQKLSEDKFVAVIDRYVKQTLASPFCKDRCAKLGVSPKMLLDKLKKHKLNKPLKVYTNPTFTIGQEKEIDPELENLATQFPYVQDIVEYLTYKHRRNSILGGGFDPEEDDEDDFESGFIPNVRTDGRIPTPADSLGCACITEDSLILTDSGLKRVVDVMIGDLVLTHTGQYDRVIDKIDNGIREVLRVEDSNGNVLNCTKNHKFFTPSGWVKAEDLSAGSVVFSYQSKEIWGKVSWYSNYYVSSWGRVLSTHGNFLSLNRRESLYSRPLVDLIADDGTKTKESVGRLVLSAFDGLPPDGKECCHKDGNPTNNYIDNLYWGTSKENKADGKTHGRMLKASRNRNTNVVSEVIVNEIRDYFKINGYQRGDDAKLARQYGIHRRHVGSIRNGEIWKDGNVTNLYVQEFKVVTIKSITDNGIAPTFDVTVESSHSYIANGFVTHNTGRMQHRVVANVPRVSSLYGANMRGLFGVDTDLCYQHAYDFASLENRINACYCWKYDSTKEYCNSLIMEKPLDCHTLMAKAVSKVINQDFSRQSAKSVSYACVYGAQAARIAKTVGCSVELGQQIYDTYWAVAEPLAKLRDAVSAWWKCQGEKKFIPGLDGRKIMTRAEHALLNSLFQSAGVICAKRTMFIQDRLTKERGYSVDFWKEDWKAKQYIQQLIAYHDEAQSEITKGLVKWKKFATKDEAKAHQAENPLWAGPIENEKGFFMGTSVADEILQEAIEQTNKYYKLKVPLAVEPQYGRNWRECH